MEAQQDTDETLDSLAGIVKASGLTPAGLQSLVLDLGPQESRLFARLMQGPADTVAIRNGCSIGNISQVRRDLNAKLEAAGDPRRVVCSLVPWVNQFGNRGKLGEWRLLDLEAANDVEGVA